MRAKKSQPRRRQIDADVERSELAEILNLSEKEVVRLTRAGVLHRKSERRGGHMRVVYDLKDNFRRFVRHGVEPAERAREDYAVEKRDTQRIVRQQKELELAIARGDMIKRDRVVRVMTNLLGQIKNHMLGLPARVFRQLIMQRDPHKIRTILDGGVRNCLIEANKFGSHSFDEHGRNGATSDENDSISRIKVRVAKRRRRKS